MPPFTIRQATLADIPVLDSLIEASVTNLAVGHYDREQIESSLRHLFGVDRTLITDGTYLVAEAAGDVVACGGWSFRRTPFGSDHAGEVRDQGRRVPGQDAAVIRAFFVHPAWTRRGLGGLILQACEDAATRAGFDRWELTATLMGHQFYRAAGYRDVRPVDVELPDGQVLRNWFMVKP